MAAKAIPVEVDTSQALAWEGSKAVESPPRRGFGRSGTRAVQRLVASIVALMVVGVSTILLASPASADATGCAYYGGIGPIKGIPIYNGSYCATVHGSGSFVYDVNGSASSWGTLCNWDITAEFFDANWRWKSTRVSNHHDGCTHVGTEWIPVYDKMQNLVGSSNGYMCSTLRVASQRITSVCHYIHA